MDINTPKVSVLMAVYNNENTIAEAIESILSQSFADFEFIIIDDGSNDNTVGVINSFSDKRIILLKNENNLKLAASLNNGLKITKGEYIARMDGDDVALPQRLERQVNFLNTNKSIDISGTFISWFGDLNKTVVKYPIKHEYIVSSLLFKNPLAHPSVMIRKEFLDKNNLLYDESYLRNQDYDLWLRAFDKGAIFENIPEVLLKQRTDICEKKISLVNKNNVFLEKILQRQIDSLRLGQKESFCIKKLFFWDLRLSDLAMMFSFFAKLNIKNCKQNIYPKISLLKLSLFIFFKNFIILIFKSCKHL